jgi:hypothetical protein
MADLHKYTVQEALNASTGPSGEFTIADAASGGLGGSSGASITAGSSADVTNTKHMDLENSTTQLLVYAAGDIYFNFATSDLDVDADTNLILPGQSLTSIAVPRAVATRGSGDIIRFNFNSTSTTAHVVRIVEV